MLTDSRKIWYCYLKLNRPIVENVESTSRVIKDITKKCYVPHGNSAKCKRYSPHAFYGVDSLELYVFLQ